MSRRDGLLRRQVSRDAIRKELLVFVEGLRTEETYLVDWHRRHRDRVHVTIDPFRGGPLQLVEHAVATRSAELADARRQRGRPHDQIWCVFDFDEHPNVVPALNLASTNGISVGLSNPCLELWFLLHFQNQTAFIDRHQAQHQVKSILHCDKVLTPSAMETLAERYGQAKERAITLDERHLGDGSPPGSNPSSSLWRLVDEIRS